MRSGRCAHALAALQPADHQLRLRRQLRHDENRDHDEKTRTCRPRAIGDIMLCFDTPKRAAGDLPAGGGIRRLRPVALVASRPDLAQPVLRARSLVGRLGESARVVADLGNGRAPGLGFTYPSGKSIFDKSGPRPVCQWRVYVDESGPSSGRHAAGVRARRASPTRSTPTSFASFASDLTGPYPYTYTFIEPNYGDVLGGTYEGGSSQHPMDGVARGEELIKATYEAIRNSPLWERSLLIVTYDEHGGFYDSVQPGGRHAAGRRQPQ